MIAGELYKLGTGDEGQPSCMDLPEGERLRQVLINALVDIDLEYEREREVLSRSSLGAASKARLLTKLKDQHRTRRQPYMHRLAALQELV